jgi:hypothetical protein
MPVTRDEDFKKLVLNIQNDPTVPASIKQQAQEALASGPAYIGDRWIYRIVVSVLGAAVLITICAGFALAFLGSQNYKMPPELVALGSAAVGALAGLLAPAPHQGGG